jgi:hypothetical protein
MSRGVALPVHKVLLLLPPPKGTCFDNLLNLPFRGIFDNIWWWLGEVQTMFGCFMIRGKKQHVEDIVDLPCFRQIKTICNV